VNAAPNESEAGQSFGAQNIASWNETGLLQRGRDMSVRDVIRRWIARLA
jgi:hypothetical protein